MHVRLRSLTDQKATREGIKRGTQCMGLCMTSDKAADIRGRQVGDPERVSAFKS